MKRHKRILTAVLLVVATVTIIACTLAWFDMQRSVATVTVMGTPSELSVVGKKGEELKLDMSPEDGQTDENGTVTVKKIIGVKTNNNHWLEIAHTTNTDNFDFKIYQAVENGETYEYDKSAPIDGSYLNLSEENPKTADASIDPFYGNNFTRDEDGENGDKVQVNAIPLYWMSCQLEPTKSSEITYYCLEVTWLELNKETDVFYVFASDAVTQ